MSTKRKAPGKLAQPTVRPSAKTHSRNTIDEAKTSVSRADAIPSSAPETIEISSDPGSEDEDLSDEEEPAAALVNGQGNKQINGTVPSKKTISAVEKATESSDDEEATSPSFGELLRGNDAIDVTALLQQSDSTSKAVARRPRTAIAPPNHQSLTTVLTQALKTDDAVLLESCLTTSDSMVVRNTVEGIDSTIAGTLLNKLAARLYRKPGRAGSLMSWVQWTLIAHGGALASQPKVVQGLSGLQKVLAERSKGLNSLLALKGKLDLLEGQMNMRRNPQKRRRRQTRLGEDDPEDEDDDEDVIWVEGEVDNSSEKALSNGGARRSARGGLDDDDDARIANGILADSSDEDDDSEGEDVEEDDDAEESLDEDDVDHNDMDDGDESMGEDEESDVDAAPPSKMQKVGKSFSKRK